MSTTGILQRRLQSGKYMIDIPKRNLSNEELLLEFEDHRKDWQKSPTALVSTTTNFLRFIHLAFKKLIQEKAADEIQIMFIVPNYDKHIQLYSGKDLASQLRSPDVDPLDYQYEYLFEWHIPESTIVHEITMATLVRRGFNLKYICGQTAFIKFPDMRDFGKLIREHWRGVCLYDQGYISGTATCWFGFNGLNGRLAEEFFGLLFRCRGYGNHSIQMGIEDALHSYASSIGDGLADFAIELSDLREAVAALDDAYIAEVGETECGCFDEPDQLGRALAAVQDVYQDRRNVLEGRLAETYLEVGY
ncbi:hypothetical protein LTR82_017625 [Friedmanniomyces endolithicus]|uniref:DUF7587 domain-containing protein n=1 Tax=Friedmanniomyces endolithicus TaxID=329885 RepID=A0AAN6J457_9PEZI|nr:hypothetical protein LTR82_017625 [Friedmanniomyces endolithicus]